MCISHIFGGPEDAMLDVESSAGSGLGITYSRSRGRVAVGRVNNFAQIAETTADSVADGSVRATISLAD